MKTTRLVSIGFTLLFAVGLASLILLLAQTPTRAAPGPDRVLMHQETAAPDSPQGNIFVIYTNTTHFAIPDGGCMNLSESTLDVMEDMYIHSIKVGVKITHAMRGDLNINLLSPDALSVRLIDMSGSMFRNYNVLFDPFSTDPPEGPPGNVDHDPLLPDYEYVWRPLDDLNIFYQNRSQGTWALQFCDGSPNSITGELLQWTLELELGPAVADLSDSLKDAPIESAISSTVVSTTIWYNINIYNSGALTATNVHLSDVIPPDVAYISGSLTCGGGCIYDPQIPEILWDGDIAPFGLETLTFRVQPLRYGKIENIARVTTISDTYDLWASTEVFPEIYQFWNFEGNDGGFIGDYSWEHGMLPMDGIPMPPGYGPEMWATGFSSDYDDSMESTLHKVVDLSGIPTNTIVLLRWWEYYQFAQDDVGEISINGSVKDTISGNSGDQWVVHSIDLSPYAGQSNVALDWKVVPHYDTVTDKGWYIDDVSIHAKIPDTDIAVLKEASADPAVIAEPLIYTVTVQNLGALTATYVVMDDDLPPEVYLNSITPMSGNPDCEENPPGHVHCDYGDLLPGQAIAVVLDTSILSGTAHPGDQIVNYASVRSAENDIDPTNDYATLRTTLVDTPFTAPIVYSVTPNSAVIPSIGTMIRIDGDNFTLGMSVYLDEYKLDHVTRVTSRRLNAHVPQSVPPGTYDLEVVAPNGESGILLGAFTVLDGGQVPTAQAVLPRHGLAGSPVNVFIRGENFSPETWAALYQGNVEIAQIEGLIFINQNLLRGVLPSSVPIGLYDLRAGDSRGITTLMNAYESVDPASYDDLFAVNDIDIWLRPPAMRQTDVVTVGVNVRRRGGQSALTNIPVDYYWDAPSTVAGGTLIGTPLVPLLPPRSLATATLTQTLNMTPGIRTFYAVIDPQNVVSETNESNNIISRTVRILPPAPGYTPPVIDDFTINWGARVAVRPQVVLNLNASPTPMFVLYLEYQYIQSENAWVHVASSGWLPYDIASRNYTWRMQSVPGVHYIQAWVADRNGNISSKPALAYINLMQRESHLAQGEVHIYRTLLTPGNYLARLSLAAGEIDFYIWAPDGSRLIFEPANGNYYEVPFIIPVTGTYQIEIEGYTSADYRLDITARTAHMQTWQFAPQDVNMPYPRGRGVGINGAEPSENTGLPDVPVAETKIYLPIIVR